MRWLDLLLTDSLSRPLARAAYALYAGCGAGGALLQQGRLDGGGRLGFRWEEPSGYTLAIGYRALELGESSPATRTRDHLTCLGFDTGKPSTPVEPARIEDALAALVRYAEHAAGPAGEMLGQRIDAHWPALGRRDPLALLRAWVRGEVGVAEPAKGGARLRTQLRRSMPFLSRRDRELAPAGSHVAFGPRDAGASLEEDTTRAVRLAVSVGPRGDALCKNRIVVYDWFTGLGSQPCAGNRIEALVDGEDTWSRTAADIACASEELCITTWWADPDIELTRPSALTFAPPVARRRHRLQHYIEDLAKRGGRSAILTWDFLRTPLFHRTLRRWALETGDNVEVLQRDNPELTGSFHQKTIVIDRRIAYCGGFNLRQNDWDTQAHRIHEPRRNPHQSDADFRRRALPAYGPRHDVAVRIEGPLVTDVHDNFTVQWNTTLAAQSRDGKGRLGALWARIHGAGPATRVEPIKRARQGSGRIVAQLVDAQPKRIPREQPIHDLLLRAIHNARRFIYVENQYFRSARIADALVGSLIQHPDMEVIVVTNRIDEPRSLFYGAAWHTASAERRVSEASPRFRLYELLTSGIVEGRVVYQPIHVHSKVMIVDDEWCTVGSANFNDRSILTESEANVAIEDAAFAKRLRCRLMAEHLALDADDPRLARMSDAACLWRTRADAAAEARRRGLVTATHAHPFTQKPSLAWLRGKSVWF